MVVYQASRTLAMTLALLGLSVDARAAEEPPPWSAPASTATISERITFTNEGATLVGTLVRPKVNSPIPAVVVFHSAAVPLEDAALYDHLRRMLPSLGIAVLTFDRRGTGRSSGNARGNSFDTLANDGIAGGRALQSISAIDPRRIGFWGLSQGGWLTLLAASRWTPTAFAISVSAPIVTPDVQMNFYTANILRINGFSQADIDQAIAARRARDEAARGTLDIATARARINRVADKPWFESIYLDPALSDENVKRWGEEMRHDPLNRWA